MQEQGMFVSAVSYATAICACSRAGKAHLALELYKRAAAAGLPPGGGTHHYLLRAPFVLLQ